MTKKITISVSKDFSTVPAGRFITDGPNSGERFRNDFLKKNLEENDSVTVIIDGVEGYGSSFLEEAFGGLVREFGFKKEDLKKKLEINFSEPEFKIYSDMIWEYIEGTK